VAVDGGDAAEEELADVGDGHGVEPRYAFACELADEVAEECVDGFWSGEVFHVAEQFGGDVVAMPLVLLFEQACVMGAEVQIGNGGEETAVAAEAVDVAAACRSRSRSRVASYRLPWLQVREGLPGGRVRILRELRKIRVCGLQVGRLQVRRIRRGLQIRKKEGNARGNWG
jgi:hypothetical protein